MDATQLSKTERLFVHVYSDGSRVITFAVTSLMSSVGFKLLPTTQVRLSHELGVTILEHGLIDNKKLSQMVRSRPTEPIIFLRGVEGFERDVLVDGAHRYCAALAQHASMIDAVRIPQSLWERFVVTGLPTTVEGMDAVLGVSRTRKLH